MFPYLHPALKVCLWSISFRLQFEVEIVTIEKHFCQPNLEAVETNTEVCFQSIQTPIAIISLRVSFNKYLALYSTLYSYSTLYFQLYLLLRLLVFHSVHWYREQISFIVETDIPLVNVRWLQCGQLNHFRNGFLQFH